MKSKFLKFAFFEVYVNHAWSISIKRAVIRVKSVLYNYRNTPLSLMKIIAILFVSQRENFANHTFLSRFSVISDD